MANLPAVTKARGVYYVAMLALAELARTGPRREGGGAAIVLICAPPRLCIFP